MKKFSVVIVFVFWAAAIAFYFRSADEHCEKTALAMHTVVTLRAEGREAEAAVAEGMERIRELEANIDADTAKLHAAAGRDYVALSPEVYRMLDVSQKYSALTDGAWDVTTGALVALWGIGTNDARVPSPQEIAAAKSNVGYRHLHLRAEDQSAMLDAPNVRLNLGGIAKGFAVDEVRRIFRRHGVQNGLIDIGTSSMYALGKNENGAAWRIGLKNPRPEKEKSPQNGRQNEYRVVVELSDAAIATSGDYERFFEQDGRRYSHIFDPHTGMPAASGVVGVTVIVGGEEADCGMTADLLATAVFVMGKERGENFVASLPFAVSCEIVEEE